MCIAFAVKALILANSLIVQLGDVSETFTSFTAIGGRTGGGERERVRIGCIDRERVMRGAAHGGRAGAAPIGAFLS